MPFFLLIRKIMNCIGRQNWDTQSARSQASTTRSVRDPPTSSSFLEALLPMLWSSFVIFAASPQDRHWKKVRTNFLYNVMCSLFYANPRCVFRNNPLLTPQDILRIKPRRGGCGDGKAAGRGESVSGKVHYAKFMCKVWCWLLGKSCLTTRGEFLFRTLK